MHESTNKQNGLGFNRLIKATKCSVNGFKTAWLYESAFRQEVALAFVLFPLSFVLADNEHSWVLLCSSVLMVLFAEIINSAIEAVADSVTLEHNILIGRAKDLGSSAVFIAFIILILVWGEAITSAVL